MSVKVFYMNECEWWAGDCTPEEILIAYLKETGVTLEEAVDTESGLPEKISDEAMDRIQFHWDSGEETISFREALDRMIAEGQKFPCLFASTEW